MTKCLVYFNEDGEQTKSKQKFAAIESNGTFTRYLIGYITTGVDAGYILNPYSMYYTPDILKKHDKFKGRDYVELKEVDEAVFNLYIKFLKTKNECYLRQAERVI